MSSSIHSRLNHYREPAYAVDGTGQENVFLDSLQSAATPIIGRDEEVRSIATLLCDVDTRIVTLTGTAGVGKTRLAREIASDAGCSRFFENGIGFVPLETLWDAELVLPVIASAIGLDHPVAGATLVRLVAKFDDRRVLLVLDNFEQVGAAAPDISRLVDQCPGLTILVTNRRALNIRAEMVFPVSPLALPGIGPEVRPADIGASPAGRTLLQLIRRRNRAYSLAPGDAPVLAAICHHLDGVPLALELAAARLGVLSASGLLHHLENHASILGEGPIDLPPRQRTMHDAVAWSYDLLTESEQRWFRRLSVLEGSFDLGMAQEVCDPDGSGEGTALDILTGLVRASLVSADGAGNG
jgi:predicted ATPase